MTPGVCVSGEAASFTMNDGGIAGNRGLFNGAVFVYGAKDQDESRSSFVLNGGEISGNRINEYRKNGSSDSGGAVSVYRASCFRMEGGKISDNVTYVVEDVTTNDVDQYQYTLNFNPNMWLPIEPGIVD